MNRRPEQAPFLTAYESVPAHEELGRSHPMVVIDDHTLCAGKSLTVHRMAGPHMHTQVEFNLVLHGEITYRFNGGDLVIPEGQLVLFWGMVPHQVIAAPLGAKFICIYAPISLLLKLPHSSTMRAAIFGGAMVRALDIYEYDTAIFQKWREDLIGRNINRAQLVSEEIASRLRRIDFEGWTKVGATEEQLTMGNLIPSNQMKAVERITQSICDTGCRDVNVEDIARTSGLHVNYAMSLYRRATGMTIKQALTRHRLDAMHSMLITTERSVVDICFECGFGSLSTCYDAFARRYSCSPGHFRRNASSKGTKKRN